MGGGCEGGGVNRGELGVESAMYESFIRSWNGCIHELYNFFFLMRKLYNFLVV